MMRRLMLALATTMPTMLCAQHACAAASAPTNDAPIDVMRLIPEQAHAAIVFPSLKRSSDGISRLLEGMDRANLLMGARPIDHLKSITGWNAGVNDQGAAAIIVLDVQASPVKWAALVPVTNAAEFIAFCFTDVDEGEDNARRSVDGTVMYVRDLKSHVVLSNDAQVLSKWDDPPLPLVDLPTVDEFLQWSSGDALIMLRSPATGELTRRIKNRLGRFQDVIPKAAFEAPENLDRVLFAVQCDPLAMIIRSDWQFAQPPAEADLRESDAEPSRSASPADLLPADSYALSMMIDVHSLGGRAGLNMLLRRLGVSDASLPDWIDQVHGAAISVSPGPTSALLSNAAMRLSVSDSTHFRSGIEAWMGESGRDVRWTRQQTLADGLAADGFALAQADASPENANRIAMEAMLFGTAGLRGYINESQETITITFVQRPSLLARFVSPSQRLSESPALRVMRQWMPSHRDIEGFINPAQVATMAKNSAELLKIPLPPLPPLPLFDEALPPIGWAVDVRSESAVGSLILPTGVLALVFDEALRTLQGRRQP